MQPCVDGDTHILQYSRIETMAEVEPCVHKISFYLLDVIATGTHGFDLKSFIKYNNYAYLI